MTTPDQPLIILSYKTAYLAVLLLPMTSISLIPFRHLKMQVQRKLNQSLLLAEAYFKRKFTMPEVNYELRGIKAGVAYLQKNEIKFNRTLLQENMDEFIRQVVPHELAHLIVYQMFGCVKPHGKEWQLVMNEILSFPQTLAINLI